ncbi:MAG: sulfatase, partial [Acidobacteriota bacterium]
EIEILVDDGTRQSVLKERHEPKRPWWLVPDDIEVDLGPWAGRRVELILALHTDATPECQAVRWSSPRIVERRRPKSRKRAAVEQPNILLLTPDTLRADALGAWGRRPSVTPALDALAENSDVYLETYATSNNTNPSFISLMTGLHAKNHLIYDLRTPLPTSHTTLAELLRDGGYSTRAVISATHLGHAAGLEQGFDVMTVPLGQYYAETVVDIALGWLDSPRQLPTPFFLWLHFFDPHVPHAAPEPYMLGYRPVTQTGMARRSPWTPFREIGRRAFDPRSPRKLQGHADFYPGEVAYLDRQIDRLLGYLASTGLDRDTIIIVVADHGETLGERGSYFDHVGLHDNNVHVPLIVHMPRQGHSNRIHKLIHHFDLFPAILQWAGVPVPEKIDARNMLDLGSRGRRAVFSSHANNSGWMVRTHKLKYWVNQSEKTVPLGPYLYDLTLDPDELFNLAGKGDPREAEMADLLTRWRRDVKNFEEPTAIEVDPETRERLRALGYAQ